MPLGDVVVGVRVGMRHPDVSEYSVRVAWRDVVRFMPREGTDPLRYVAVGYDERGRLLEMVAVLDELDKLCVSCHEGNAESAARVETVVRGEYGFCC